jgi:hypothetical protein
LLLDPLLGLGVDGDEEVAVWLRLLAVLTDGCGGWDLR